jgi:hypothetical protein
VQKQRKVSYGRDSGNLHRSAAESLSPTVQTISDFSRESQKYDVYSANDVLTVISSIFPILPVVILFFTGPLIVSLGLILIFTVLFAVVLVVGMQNALGQKCWPHHQQRKAPRISTTLHAG